MLYHIIDSTNLERNLYLTTRLLDMDVDVVIALNMYDELIKKRDKFDYIALGQMLGIPFIPTVGSRAKGLGRLLLTAVRMSDGYYRGWRKVRINYSSELEFHLRKLYG